MQLGGLAGMTALTMGLGQEGSKGQKEGDPKKDPDERRLSKDIVNRNRPETLQ
jgi:hypothetical protein